MGLVQVASGQQFMQRLCAELGFDGASDETSCSFHKGDVIRQAALEQHSNVVVTRHVCGCSKSYILPSRKFCKWAIFAMMYKCRATGD